MYFCLLSCPSLGFLSSPPKKEAGMGDNAMAILCKCIRSPLQDNGMKNFHAVQFMNMYVVEPVTFLKWESCRILVPIDFVFN